ncbi:MAG TPA: cation:proton antiporter [Vicinamibacterales bacterium]|nr:cation:proton antiporter [Vicinamibacterales bacterium]
MPRVLALALTVAIVWLVVAVGPPLTAAMRPGALALGFALIAAALAGALIERIHLPRVSGYLLFGLVCGPYLGNIITRPMARDLQIINALAVALIAFIAGLEINVTRLLPRVRDIARLGGATIGILYVVLLAFFWTAWPWLGIAPGLHGTQRFAVALLLTTIVASFSPTVTIAQIAECRARGPLTELTLAIVVFADLLLILAFTLVMELVRGAFGGAPDVGLVAGVSWEILGSFAFGALAGALFALYLHFIGREVPVVLLALCALISGVGARLHVEPLLAALAAGLVVENVAPPRGDVLKAAVERGALPVLVVFFAAAGASLQLDALAAIGTLALIVSGLRLGLIRAGVWLGTRAARLRDGPADLVWMGFVSQAGVTLGLTLIVAVEYPQWGAPIQTLMVALIALHQLIGPVLFKSALARTGEIGAMDRVETTISSA